MQISMQITDAYSVGQSRGVKLRAVCLTTFVVLLICCGAFALMALLPEASGDVVYDKGDTTIDASHSDQGYVMVKHETTQKHLKVRISLGKATYTYDLRNDGEYETFPLQLGDGKYKVQVFKQASGSKYSSDASVSFKVKVSDDNLPFLYPNQYVCYTADSAAVQKSEELCGSLQTDAEKVQAVYDFVVTNIVYDHIRALTVESGYIPVIDDVLAEQKGICFDYSALVACMLRVQGIPTRLVIGYADKTYHAWNSVLIDGEWVRYDATAAASNMTVKKYTEERVY